MKQFKNILRQNRGDTIVEVLVAMAIVSLILVSAFVTSNHSLAATRDAQEHAEASQVLRSQIELARTLYAAAGTDGGNQMLTTHSLFCLYTDASGSPQFQTFTGSSYPAGGASLLSLNDDQAQFKNYPDPCQYNPSSLSYSYNIAVENHWTDPTLIPNDDGTLIFHARWFSTNGSPNEVTYTYRGHSG